MNGKSAFTGRLTPNGKLIPFRRVQGLIEEMSDETLLTACAAGEAAALGALFDRFGERVGRFLRRVTKVGDDDVPDLLQATFFEAQRSARRFRRQSSVSTWLIGIAANIVRHHVRSEHRRSKAHAAFAVCQQDMVITPGEEAERRQHLTRLSEGIDALPEEIRVVYVMCEIEDISGREAARALAISEGTIWRRMHTAREILRRVISGEQA